MSRAFTDEEVRDLKQVVRRCFTGRGSDADTARAEELRGINPPQYSELSEAVRAEERALVNPFS